MSEPVVKIGTYTGGSIQSVALGFVPDFLQITNMTSGLKVYQAYPNRTSFSNGTCARISSVTALLGAAGNNHFGDTNPGSYVMSMGGINDLTSSTKQKGFYAGKKLSLAATKYIYVAYRSGAGEQAGL